MKRLLIVFVLMLSILEADIDEARKVYAAKNFKKAFPMFEQLSKDGNIESNYYLGNMYQFGNGVTQDNKKAFKYYSIAVSRDNKKNLKSNYILALMYAKGLGVKQNYKKTLEILQILDNKNIAVAQSMIGIMYSNGYGVQEDQKKALFYVKKSCNNKKSYPKACYYAGDYYEKGIAVKKNYETAKKYYEKACKAGIKESCVAIKNMKEPLSFYQKYVNFIRTPEYHIFMIILLAVGLWRLWRKKKRESLLDEKQDTLK